VLRLWWFMSPGLYSLSQLDDTGFLRDHEWVRVVAGLNPFAILFESYRAITYGTPDGQPFVPDPVPLLGLLVASLIFLAVATLFFKRLEPNFAKVL
jgi:ABC-type polysaccharide/polyol phosphate export permease